MLLKKRFSQRQGALSQGLKATVFLPSVLGSFLTFFSSSAIAQQMAWDAPSDTDLAGYILSWGAASRTYSQTREVGLTTSADLAITQPGRYYVGAQAFDNATPTRNVSGFSNEVIVLALAPSLDVTQSQPPVQRSFTVDFISPTNNAVLLTKTVTARNNRLYIDPGTVSIPTTVHVRYVTAGYLRKQVQNWSITSTATLPALEGGDLDSTASSANRVDFQDGLVLLRDYNKTGLPSDLEGDGATGFAEGLAILRNYSKAGN